MSRRVDSESKVSGNQANVPARIRRELDIEDGDTLRWRIEDDGAVRVDVVRTEEGTFEAFDGYDGSRETDATSDHDAWGVDENLRFSSASQNASGSGDADE